MRISDSYECFFDEQNSKSDSTQKNNVILHTLFISVFLLFVTIYIIGFIMEPKTRYYNHRKGVQQILNTVFINPVLRIEDTENSFLNICFKLVYKNGGYLGCKNISVANGGRQLSSMTDINGIAMFENIKHGQSFISVNDSDGSLLGECTLEISICDDGSLSLKIDNSEFTAHIIKSNGRIIYIEIELVVDEGKKTISMNPNNISYLTENGEVVTPGGTFDAKNFPSTPNDVKILPDGTIVSIKEYPEDISPTEVIIITPDGDVIIIKDKDIFFNGSETPATDDKDSEIKITPDGGIKLPDGTIITPDGEVIPPDDKPSSGGHRPSHSGSNPSGTEYTTGSGTSGSTAPTESGGSSQTDDEKPSQTDTSGGEVSRTEPSDSGTSPTEPTGSSTTPTEPSGSGTKPSQTKPSGSHGGGSRDEPQESGDVTVYQRDTAWNQLSSIDIFNDVDNLFPGASGSYVFRVVNTNRFDVEFTFSITEKEHPVGAIPLVYKLKKGGKYIVGSAGDSGWVTADYLREAKVPLGAECDISYELEWKWMFERGDDAYDTSIGGAENLIHKFYFKVYVEQII